MTNIMREEWKMFVGENITNFSKDANGIKYEFYEDDLLEFIQSQLQSVFEEIENRLQFLLEPKIDEVIQEIRSKYCNSDNEPKFNQAHWNYPEETELLVIKKK